MTSSWISSILYKRLPDGSSYLAVFQEKCIECQETGKEENFLTGWKCTKCKGTGKRKEPSALLYGGPVNPIPSWLPGLISAGTGKRSPGLAYNRLLKGKYPYQRIEGSQAVSELR